ncbi:MAG: hypothetical protein JSR60_01000 [Proteobacteria bacterium]|nr:hypothetical protein [Pseudomonadota bacterium]
MIGLAKRGSLTPINRWPEYAGQTAVMSNSKSLAGLIGPTLLAVTSSETINLRIWEGAPATLVYLNGCLLFVAGLAILRAHNVWTWRWPVLITIVGWLALAAGLYRTFLPTALQGGSNLGTYALIGTLFIIGAILTAMSLRAR